MKKPKNVLLSVTALLIIAGAIFLPQEMLHHQTGDLIGTIQVSDPNLNTKFTFDILSGNEHNLVKIDEFGNIWILSGKGMDRMAGKNLYLRVRVCDNGVRSGVNHDKQVPLSVVPRECSEADITIKVSKLAARTRLWKK